MRGQLRSFEPNAKEKSLRAAIISVPAFGLPIAPSTLLGWTTVWIIFTVLAAVSGGYVVLFYGVWLLGVFEGGPSYWDAPQLIGDDNLYAPPLYWPWGRYQRRIRQVRRVRALEREVGISEPWPFDG